MYNGNHLFQKKFICIKEEVDEVSSEDANSFLGSWERAFAGVRILFCFFNQNLN